MTEKKKQIEIIKSDFKDAQPILNVVGDETRQLINWRDNKCQIVLR